MGIQQDFGGFDPSFIGITTSFGNERIWRFFQDFKASPLPLPVSDLPDAERFEALSATSVISHEIRHFHDFFLTPYSAHVFRLRIQMLVNLLGILSYSLDKPANCFPVPLSKWCRLDSSKRQQELSWLGTRSDHHPWNPVNIPYIANTDLDPQLISQVLPRTTESLELLIKTVTFQRERINYFTYNPKMVSGNTSFQPWQIFELSAVIIQIEDIWHTYGEEESMFFINYLASSNETPYSMMLKIMAGMFRELNEPIDSELISAMVTWCLLGSYEKDKWLACPTERFARLLNLLLTVGIDNTSDLYELFDVWSTSLELSSVQEGLTDAKKTFHRLRDNVENLLLNFSDTRFIEEYGRLIFRVIDGVAKSSDHMIEQFYRNPVKYVAPKLYVENIRDYVNPTLRVKIDGGGLRPFVPVDELKRRGYIVEWAFEDETGDELIHSMIEPYELSIYSYLKAKDVHYLSTLINLTDYVFAETSRNRKEIQLAGKAFFKNDMNLTPFEVF